MMVRRTASEERCVRLVYYVFLACSSVQQVCVDAGRRYDVVFVFETRPATRRRGNRTGRKVEGFENNNNKRPRFKL